MSWLTGYRTYIVVAVTGALTAVVGSLEASGKIDAATAAMILKYAEIIGGALAVWFLRAAVK